MFRRKRGLFQPDLGDHPPPLNEYFAGQNRFDYRSRTVPEGMSNLRSPTRLAEESWLSGHSCWLCRSVRPAF